MRSYLEGTPERSMAQPTGLVTVRIDPKTGKQASPGQSDAIFEVFRVENVPKEAVAPPSVNLESGIKEQDEAPAPEALF